MKKQVVATLSPSEFTAAHLQLYTGAFPEEERRPADNLVPDDKAFAMYNIAIPGEPVAGLITLWDFGTFRYVEHFAIDPTLRGQGVGRAVLDALEGPLLLEVEPAEMSSEATRRIAFYERAGFRVLDFPYIQPPYSAGLPSVELRLMVRGDIGVDAARAAEILHARVYRRVQN